MTVLVDDLGVGVAWVVGIAAALTALGIIGKACASGYRRAIGTQKDPGWIRRLVRLVDDLRDVPGQVVVLQQNSVENAAGIAAIKAELHPNGGSSFRDVADRIEVAVGTLTEGTTP